VAAVQGTGLPVYRVALDAEFPQTLARHARHGPVVMIVRDKSFEPVFLRLLEQLSVPADHIERLKFVDPAQRTRAVSDA
jgi:hypothetical protein